MKLPHQYLPEYLKAQNKEEQRQALQGLPKEWQDLFRTHLRIQKMWEEHNNKAATNDNPH